MKVALIQMNSGSDKAANLEQARGLIEQAVREEKPDWICLPEVYDHMGGSLRDKQAAAEKLPDGPAWTMMRDLAKKHGVFIHGGSILEKLDGEERLGNTTVVFDRKGAELARYRKIHMFDIVTPDGQEYRESKAYRPGDCRRDLRLRGRHHRLRYLLRSALPGNLPGARRARRRGDRAAFRLHAADR